MVINVSVETVMEVMVLLPGGIVPPRAMEITLRYVEDRGGTVSIY